MILRYWGVENWSQFEIHQYGFQTFEGGISEGDLGLLPLFKLDDLLTKKKEKIQFHVELITNGTINDLKKWIDNEIPLILRYNTNDRGDMHTVVLIGYNEKVFYKHDNDLGSCLEMEYDYMKKHWKGQVVLVYPINYLTEKKGK
jgi:ABC-type bacteriocin/lantibiotic exporter with double-glycine peptidase domain